MSIGTLWDFKNCVTDNLFWAKLLCFGVFVKEIIQKLFVGMYAIEQLILRRFWTIPLLIKHIFMLNTFVQGN
jgi:hypothetical protein